MAIASEKVPKRFSLAAKYPNTPDMPTATIRAKPKYLYSIESGILNR